MSRLLVALVTAYRRWVSPMLMPRCRFYPSCSEYAVVALQRHGALRGSWLTLRRLLRCQPLFTGGYDPVPPPRSSSVETATAEPAWSRGPRPSRGAAR